MVPPTAQITQGGAKAGGAPPLPAPSSHAALGGLAALPSPQAGGPITGVSTVNARLPGTSLPPMMTPPAIPPGMRPVGLVSGPMVMDDDDDDDEPNAKKPRLDDGSLLPEQKWMEKHQGLIQVLVQVNLGADALAANIPSVIPLDVSVRTRVFEMKQMLTPRVSAAGVSVATMKLKAQGPGYILKNANSLAFYNVAPGNVIELTKKQRGGGMR